MHTALLVIGDDPIGQLVQGAPDDWNRAESTATVKHGKKSDDWYGDDWYGIGGRYSGSLIPMPGATSGRVYGDAMPGLEAALAGYVPEGATMSRPGLEPRDGVDQIRLGELDIVATLARFNATAVVVNGVTHTHDLTGEETGLAMALAMAATMPGVNLAPGTEDGEEAQSVMRKLDAWDAKVRRLLSEADPTELVSVVDAHS